jgi:hypothetical protein
MVQSVMAAIELRYSHAVVPKTPTTEAPPPRSGRTCARVPVRSSWASSLPAPGPKSFFARRAMRRVEDFAFVTARPHPRFVRYVHVQRMKGGSYDIGHSWQGSWRADFTPVARRYSQPRALSNGGGALFSRSLPIHMKVRRWRTVQKKVRRIVHAFE